MLGVAWGWQWRQALLQEGNCHAVRGGIQGQPLDHLLHCPVRRGLEACPVALLTGILRV